MKRVRWCGAIAASLVGMAVCVGEARAQTGCAGSATIETTLQFDPMAEYTDFYFTSEIPTSCFDGDSTVVDGGVHSSQRVVDANDSSLIYYCYDGLAGPPDGDPACPGGGPAMPTLLGDAVSVNMNIGPPRSGEAFFSIFVRVQYRPAPSSVAVSLHYRWFENADDPSVAGTDAAPDPNVDAGTCDEPTAGSSSSPQVGMCSRCSSLGGDCPPDCCEGLMCGDNAVCCVPEGGSCANTGDCCGAALCAPLGVCVSDNQGPCKAIGETCSDAAECCNDTSATEEHAACRPPVDKYGNSSGTANTGSPRCCIPGGGVADAVEHCCDNSGSDLLDDPAHRVRCYSYDNKTEGCSAVRGSSPTTAWWLAPWLVFAVLRLKRRVRRFGVTAPAMRNRYT